MTFVLAAIGAKALYLLYGWLLSAVAASWLSARKGFGEKPGLAAGLLLTVVGVILWLVWPAKADSRWKVQGPLPWGSKGKTVAEARAERSSPGD
ncbi:MAG TPA: hypothetical protein VGF21_12380 [Thermoleophilaceae bacterium]|jgi:hypothetical protein